MKFIVLILLFLSSCRKASDQKIDQVLNINLTGNIATLDPALSYDVVSVLPLSQVYETLFDYEYLKRPFQLKPLLAQAMPSISDDKLTYTIPIKKEIFYHPDPCFKGKKRELKAQDFITALKRIAFKPTRSNGWFLYDQKIQGINEFRQQAGDDLHQFASLPIQGLTALDDHTLQVKLTKIYPQLLYALSLNFSAPIPLEIVQCYKNDLNDHLVGTGPYLIESFNRDSHVHLVKNEHYRSAYYPSHGDRYSNTNKLLKDAGKKIPILKRVEFKVEQEEQTRWLKFLKGDFDILVVPKDNFSSALSARGELTPELKQKGIRLEVGPSMTYWWISFNLRDPIMKNKNLRLAIAHALDIDKFLTLFTNNTGQRAFSIYPPGLPGYSPINRLNFEHDLERAKKYLIQAGYPEGKGIPTLTFETRRVDTTSRQMGGFIRQQLAKIGIDVKIQMNNYPQFLEKARTGKLAHFYLDGWALDYPDAENVVQLLSSQSYPPGPNSNYYHNPKVDDYIEQLKFLDNDEEKYVLMEKIEKEVQSDLPWIMLYYDRKYILYYSKVKNYRYSPFSTNYIKYLKLEENITP